MKSHIIKALAVAVLAFGIFLPPSALAAFGNVQIVSVRNGGTPISGWRQDLSIADVVSMSLTSNTGVTSYRWTIIGRPEGSVAGGSGPEPVLLGTGSTASFTVDDDSGALPRDGTYIIGCTLNGGSPSETLVTVGLSRVVSGKTFNGLALRRLGGFEAMQDTSNPQVRQGWSTMLNRWLGCLASGQCGGGGVGGGGGSGGAGGSGGSTSKLVCGGNIVCMQGTGTVTSLSYSADGTASGTSVSTGHVVILGNLQITKRTGTGTSTATATVTAFDSSDTVTVLNTATSSVTATGVTKGNYIGGLLTSTALLAGSDIPALSFVVPSGEVCAGKIDSTTSTSTATSTGTLYQTSAQPATCTITSTATGASTDYAARTIYYLGYSSNFLLDPNGGYTTTSTAVSVSTSPSPVINNASTSTVGGPFRMDWPAGSYKLRLFANMASAPASVYFVVSAGTTLATSNTVTVATGAMAAYDLTATATADYASTPGSQPLLIQVFASSASTNNMTVGYGGMNASYVSAPWEGFSYAIPLANGTASPGASRIPAMTDHVHPTGNVVVGTGLQVTKKTGTGTSTATATATSYTANDFVTVVNTATATDSGGTLYGTNGVAFVSTNTSIFYATGTLIGTGTWSNTATATASATATGTKTMTMYAMGTASITGTATAQGTGTAVDTGTATGTFPDNAINTVTVTITGTATQTRTVTSTVTWSSVNTATGTFTYPSSSTVTSAALSSNYPITYIPQPIPGGDLFLVSNFNGNNVTAFVTTPTGEGSNYDLSATPSVGSPAVLASCSEPGNGNNCSIVNRYVTSSSPTWISPGQVYITAWAKATSAAQIKFFFDSCTGGSATGANAQTVTLNVTTSDWQPLYATLPVTNGLLLPANNQLCVQIWAYTSTGTPTVTLGATAAHYLHFNGPWIKSAANGVQ
jgi:hypothetical protein